MSRPFQDCEARSVIRRDTRGNNTTSKTYSENSGKDEDEDEGGDEDDDDDDDGDNDDEEEDEGLGEDQGQHGHGDNLLWCRKNCLGQGLPSLQRP